MIFSDPRLTKHKRNIQSIGDMVTFFNTKSIISNKEKAESVCLFKLAKALPELRDKKKIVYKQDLIILPIYNSWK